MTPKLTKAGKPRKRAAGAGRPAIKSKDKAITRSFSMPPKAAEALSKLHGTMPLGAWLVKRLKLPKI